MTVHVERCAGHRLQSNTCSVTTPEWCHACSVWFSDETMSREQWTGSWCPQCGPRVAVDEDGCCASCGADAVGKGAERALAAESSGDYAVSLQRLIEALARGEVPEATDKAPHMSQVAQRAAAKLVAAKAERDDFKAECEMLRRRLEGQAATSDELATIRRHSVSRRSAAEPGTLASLCLNDIDVLLAEVDRLRAEAERRKEASAYWNRRAEEEYRAAKKEDE